MAVSADAHGVSLKSSGQEGGPVVQELDDQPGSMRKAGRQRVPIARIRMALGAVCALGNTEGSDGGWCRSQCVGCVETIDESIVPRAFRPTLEIDD